MTLADIPVGGRADVVRVNGDTELRRRLLDMGLVKGTPVTVLRNAPLQDPVEIEVKGTRLALRRTDAAEVEVEN